jgi:cell division protein FtsL
MRIQETIIEKVSRLQEEDIAVLDGILQSSLSIAQDRFNFDECEELCPWEVAVKKQQLTELVDSGRLKHEGREIAKTARIKVVAERQVRMQKVDQDNAVSVGLSLDVHSWLSELPPIIVRKLENDPHYDYELILGFTRYQEMTKLGWENTIVDVVSGQELALYEAGCDTNLHIGGGGKKNTPESIYNLAIKLVESGALPEDEKDGENPTVEKWIYQRLRDRKDPAKEKCYKDYKIRRPCKTPAQTFHSDSEGENSMPLYAKKHNLPYGGDDNTDSGYGVIGKNPKNRANHDKVDEMIQLYPDHKDPIIFAGWIPEIVLSKKDEMREKWKNAAKEKFTEKCKAIAVINKRVAAHKGADPTNADDIFEYGYNVEFRFVAQDKTPCVLLGGDPTEEDGFV